MKNFFVAFLIFVIWSFFGLWLYYNVQPLDSKATDTAEQSMLDPIKEVGGKLNDTLQRTKDRLDSVSSVGNATEVPGNPQGLQAINKNGDIIFLFDEGIRIKKNSDKINIPSTLLDFKYKINSYLIEHPDQELQIIAYYDPSENFSTPNFGESRGIQVMNILTSVGIVKERMVIKPTIKQIEFDNMEIYNNGISFIFNPLDEERFKTPMVDIPPIQTVYPKFENNDIFVDNVLKEVLKEAQSVLTNHPNVWMEIVGHTDNVGNAQDNYVVGLKYARQVRWYFVSTGKLDGDRVKAVSEGESKAIANNGTEKGRLLNRRIEIKYHFNQ